MKGIVGVILLGCLLLGAFARSAAAQTPEIDRSLDSLGVTGKERSFFRKLYDYFNESNVDRTFDRKMDWSIAPGPNYSSDTKLGLGFLIAGLYRLDQADTVTAPSTVSIQGNVTTTGFFLLRVGGENEWRHNKYRLNYNAAFVYFPGSFWGIGYDQGYYNTPEAFKNTMFLLRSSFRSQFARNTYWGVNMSMNYNAAKSSSKYDTQSSVFRDYLTASGEPSRIFNMGVGVLLQYDSRDFVSNASRGIYANVEFKVFPSWLSNTSKSFSQINYTFDWYKRVWKGGVLAYDLYGESNSRNVCWNLYAKLGGMNRMRGYYEGRFRDKHMVETQVELRQKIYNRHGVVVWTGVGNVFPSAKAFKWSHTLVSYGVGYRWEFKNRINVRLDYGFGVKTGDGKRNTAFLFSAGESF